MLDVLFAAAIGHLLLFTCCFVIWRWVRRSPNLNKRLEVVREYVNRRRRVDRARRELERARAEHIALQKLLDRMRQLVAERIEMIDSTTAMIATLSCSLVTLVLFEADTGLLTLLNGGSGLFGLSLLVWALFAPFIAAGLFIFLHMLLHMAIADEDRPRRTLKRARVGAVILGLLVIIGLWATFSGRGLDFTRAGWAADIILWGLWVLTLALGVCGAFTSLVATTAYSEARAVVQIIFLERLDEEYRAYIRTLESEITTHTTVPPAESSAGGSSNGTSSPVRRRQEISARISVDRVAG